MRGVGSSRLYGRGRGHLPSRCHGGAGVQGRVQSFWVPVADKHSTMQHNLQLETGGGTGHGLLLQSAFGEATCLAARLPAAGSSPMRNQAGSSRATSSRAAFAC